MTNTELSRNFWRYYLMLEKRVLETVETVEIHLDNFASFSNGFAMLLQAIGAELDNVFKVYCGFNPTDRKSISDYAIFILNDYPDITSQVVKIVDRDIDLKPFEGWNVRRAAQSLPWWQAFDHIKHNRHGNIQEANQGNVIKILAALFLIEMKRFKKFANIDGSGKPIEPDGPSGNSQIYLLDNWPRRYVPLMGGYAVLDEGETER